MINHTHLFLAYKRKQVRITSWIDKIIHIYKAIKFRHLLDVVI